MNRRPHRLRLHWKILLYSSALLIALIFAMLVYVRAQAASFVNGQLAKDLEEGSERIKAAENDQLASLHLTAALVGSFPVLKAALGTDLQTLRTVLTDFQQAYKGPDLLIVLDLKGAVVARARSDADCALAAVAGLRGAFYSQL